VTRAEDKARTQGRNAYRRALSEHPDIKNPYDDGNLRESWGAGWIDRATELALESFRYGQLIYREGEPLRGNYPNHPDSHVELRIAYRLGWFTEHARDQMQKQVEPIRPCDGACRSDPRALG
jgi:hypothetical protein